MKKLADFSSNYTKLERLIPYTCALLNDQAPLVKSKAIDTLTYILTKITAFPPSDSNLFNDYILPALKIICTDKSDLVRVTFAENLPLLAYQARRFLEMSQIINQNINNQVMIKGTYDSELNSLQDEIGSRVLELSMDQCTVVKRSLLKNITPLCIFYGRRKTNDFVLPMVITFLNSRQWRLRHAFFEQIVGISIFVGPTSLKEFILPCIMQALYDVQEFVIDQALNGLVALSSKQLGMADTSCFLLDILKPHLAQSIMIITEYSLLESITQPIARDTFDRAIKLLMEDLSASSRQPFQTLITQKLPQVSPEEVDKLETILPYLSQVATAVLSKSWENNNDGENQTNIDSGSVVQLNLPLYTFHTNRKSLY
ncbi:hypothetical protein FDP41_010145 [Naegleria fowleri]|uniref:Phosphatase 2A Regulatory Subunit A helical domain-containing protein n=1 Tax=Naegleria fowleri TaxID=5763 RepID=A0A6A5BES1_NAEFO|nr:uncharacterized protein FDP41_010145 [Naegleria fowleri]KAF0971539.1 hypothetical protein FDP41_010145 [Naegleria fowleri]